MNVLLGHLLAPLATLAISILTPMLMVAVTRLYTKLGIDMEARDREALQSALKNAASIAVGAALPGGTSYGASRDAIDYVVKSVPGAVSKFKLDDQRITELLKPHLIETRQRRESNR